MMLAHYIELRVFCNPEDSKESVYKKLLFFLPFDLDKEKVHVKQKNAVGFKERKIVIMNVELKKQRHINQFLKNLAENLSNEQKELILKQVEARVDERLCLYMRFDKDKLVKENTLWLTDKGSCYHLKIVLAAFPKKKEKALEVVSEILN